MAALFEPVAEGVKVRLRVQPRASRNAITGVTENGDGDLVLRIAVTAVPEDGKANAAVVKLLAKAWKMAKGNFAVISGKTDRNKVLMVSGSTKDLVETLTQWTEQNIHD